VTTQPYYAAEDIDIASQSSCAQGGCFFGVMHYIYKVRLRPRPGPPAVPRDLLASSFLRRHIRYTTTG